MWERRVFTDGRMRMRVDQARNCRNPVGINGMVCFVIQAIADGLNQTGVHEHRIRMPQRTFQLSRNQRADVFD